jgi:hypothetical protein
MVDQLPQLLQSEAPQEAQELPVPLTAAISPSAPLEKQAKVDKTLRASLWQRGQGIDWSAWLNGRIFSNL